MNEYAIVEALKYSFKALPLPSRNLHPETADEN